jgi:hypothetical protein|tara:strand:+ start:169 stop:423 length:255 start_codon:yes stop_codon:yes gene_type:complete
MTVKDCIKFYNETKCIHRKYHLNWIKENLNPILKTIDPKLNINWACQMCAKNYMNMLIRWQEIENTKKPKKRKPKNAPKKTNKN